MPTFHCSDESGHVETYRATTAARAARRYVTSGDFHHEPGTNVHSVWVRQGRSTDGSSELVVVETPPAPCSRNAGHHMWREVDAFGGENGGVRTTERCRYCGMVRHHQSRGQDRSTGQTVPGGVTSYPERESE